MPRAKTPVAKPGAKTRVGRRVAEKKAPKHAGTNSEAFYAAQKEAAADSRDYAARRRRR